MSGLIEHPDITRLLREGMPEDTPICCPVCGEECETFYKVIHEIVGCENALIRWTHTKRQWTGWTANGNTGKIGTKTIPNRVLK